MHGSTQSLIGLASVGGSCAVAQVVEYDAEIDRFRIATCEAPHSVFEAEALRGAFGTIRPAAGERVLVMFPSGDSRPVIVGCIGVPAAQDYSEDVVTVASSPRPTVAHVDGREVRLTAQSNITLECGRASITLTRDGKVTIRGVQVVSRAAGTNKVKGGSVQIN